MTQPKRADVSNEPDLLDAAVNDAIAECGGDLRTAVRALVADNLALQRELDFASLAMSFGFSRGYFARQRDARFASEGRATESANIGKKMK
ncbi:MAG: hypothetical protein KDK08_29210 [Rhizobiaceae bacterium]|nr:hypothetical protein [Rhizobiaceae bacterium]